MKKLLWRRSASSDRGVALFIALVAVVLVSFIAVLVMRITTDRYQLSKRDERHSAAFAASEAGTQYAWARMRVNDTNPLKKIDETDWPPGDYHGDPLAFKQRVQAAIAVGHPALTVSSLQDLGGGQIPDHYEPALRMDNKDVTIRIGYVAGNPPDKQYPVSVDSSY